MEGLNILTGKKSDSRSCAEGADRQRDVLQTSVIAVLWRFGLVAVLWVWEKENRSDEKLCSEGLKVVGKVNTKCRWK
nr:hypothetical protein CFP56_66266 [Quercus suber]